MVRPGSCIFCGALKLTKQHVFQRRLTTVLTADIVGSDITSELTRRSALGVHRQTWPAADIASYTAKVVCASCNNQWMNEIEARAWPSLQPMIEGRATRLPPAAQLNIAAWTALATYVVEFALGDVVVATAEERRGLMNLKHPQGAVPVRIGAVERSGVPNSVTRIVYNVGTSGTQHGYAACTTFTLGSVAVQVRHGLGIQIDWTAPSTPGVDSIPMNPPCLQDVAWPPAESLSATALAVWERPIPATDPHGISAVFAS